MKYRHESDWAPNSPRRCVWCGMTGRRIKQEEGQSLQDANYHDGPFCTQVLEFPLGVLGNAWTYGGVAAHQWRPWDWGITF